MFDYAKHRWWRMRNAGDTLFFETSPDGVDFTVFGVTTAVPGLDRSDILIDAVGVITSPAAVTIDNFNHLP